MSQIEIRGVMAPLIEDNVIIPIGMIAVKRWDFDIPNYLQQYRFQVFHQGEVVSFYGTTFLLDGEEEKVFERRRAICTEYLIRNEGGIANKAIHPDQIAKGKAFAREQAEELMRMGFSKTAAYNILKVAGPGKCVEAALWAQYALEKIPSVDLWDCILCGVGGTYRFGKERMEKAIAATGVCPPLAANSRGFFAILAGAHVAMLKMPDKA